jgi:hypothetical protein
MNCTIVKKPFDYDLAFEIFNSIMSNALTKQLKSSPMDLFDILCLSFSLINTPVILRTYTKSFIIILISVFLFLYF